MKPGIAVLAALALLGVLYYFHGGPATGPRPDAVAIQPTVADPDKPQPQPETGRGMFDISVHSVEELEVLFERAEQLAMRPRPVGGEDSIVLVLHGPEVEFFAISNYERYRSIVDRAARLDAFDVVDVKICQTMMQRYGIAGDDIPAFIEQVPDGAAELERLNREGYVYF